MSSKKKPPARKAAVQVALRRHFGIHHDHPTLENEEYMAVMMSRPTADYEMFARTCERIGAQPPSESWFGWLVSEAGDSIPGVGRTHSPVMTIGPVIFTGTLALVMMMVAMAAMPALLPYAIIPVVALVPVGIWSSRRSRPRRTGSAVRSGDSRPGSPSSPSRPMTRRPRTGGGDSP